MTMLSILLAAGLSSASSQLPVDPFLFGIGNEECKSALDPERSLEREVWIMGAWSGLNAASKKATGKGIDVFKLFAVIEDRCASNPSMLLMQVVLDVWLVLGATETGLR